MTRLPIWCAFGVPFFSFMVAPLYAATPDMAAAKAWAVPNLFDTVALQVTRTRYDAKWRHAWTGNRGPISTFHKHRAAPSALRDLASVQREINYRVSYRADSPHLGAGDVWSTAGNTLARGSGDCEDYAIVKAQSLLALGFLPQDLYLVVGNDLTSRSAHAILAVRVGAKFWVLDNLSSRVVAADQFHDFSPVITFSAGRKWIHGYKTGARQRLANARTRVLDLPTDRLTAIKIAQTAVQVARSLNP